MSKLALAAILGLTQTFKKFTSVRGEDIVIPVDTKGMMEAVKMNRQDKNIISKRKQKRLQGKKNRSNRGKNRTM